MKQKVRGRFRILLLMIISITFLMVFVGQWLLVQFKNSIADIRKDAKADIIRTNDQVLDTLMLQFVDDELDPDQLIQEISDEASAKKKVRSITQQRMVRTDTIRTERSIEIEYSFEDQDGEAKNETAQTINVRGYEEQSVKEIVAHGLGLYIKKNLNNGSTESKMELDINELDPKIYGTLLSKNWQHSDLNYRLMSQTGIDRNNTQNPVIVVRNALFKQPIRVELTNLNRFVFWQLLPQSLFAFALILVTFGAFLVVYRSYRKQVLLNELRTDFINNISHELKTPVSSVRVALEALQRFQRKNDPKIMDEYLQLMNLEVHRLDKLIHQVLTNAQLDSNEQFLDKKPTNMCVLVQDTIQNYQWKIDELNAHVSISLPEYPVLLTVDSIHIQGVLRNLLDNSLNYGGNGVCIQLAVRNTTQALVIEVSDNGPGIDPVYLPQLFDRFFRVPNGNTHNVKGYGLGLNYCEQIMHQHDGTIEVENLPERGCVFRLTFLKINQ